MKKYYILIKAFLLVLLVQLSSCSGNKEPADLSWYEGEVIEQLVDEDSTVYRVQIGIMAASFCLEKEQEGVEKELALLQESLQHKIKLDIGVEKGTSKIMIVRAAP